MLQVDVRHFASDALEDAMRLAQTKALNSYTFSDCLSFLNYAWRDIYDRMAMIDDGYYGVNVQLKGALTKLPPFVKNTVSVYAAQSPVGYDRYVYRSSGATDMTASGTYHVSGTDLYCADAARRTVWLYYVPVCPQIFFTHHNRDPKMYENKVDAETGLPVLGRPVVYRGEYSLYRLYGTTADGDVVSVDSTATRDNILKCKRWFFEHRGTGAVEDITDVISANPLDEGDGAWQICYVSCDYPYIFVTYEHSITKEHLSGFFDADRQFNAYNPFAFTGRASNVEYIDCRWNDKTGIGVVIKDWNDMDGHGLPRVKELGWTPDTQLDYPIPEMYRYLVARLADKFSALNESNVMGVQKELVESKFAFEAFLDRDKSSWKRITNVNPPTIADYL